MTMNYSAAFARLPELAKTAYLHFRAGKTLDESLGLNDDQWQEWSFGWEIANREVFAEGAVQATKATDPKQVGTLLNEYPKNSPAWAAWLSGYVWQWQR